MINNGLWRGVAIMQIEEGCNLRSASDIAEAVHHIFNFINGS